MKFNWGTGIAIFYSLFVIAMVSMVIKSFGHKSHLVKEDYYQLDLNYEAYRVKKENQRKLAIPVEINFENRSNRLHLKFPSSISGISGEVHLFRPSNKYLDKRFKIKVDSDQHMYVDLDEKLNKGLWQIKLDWIGNGTPYFQETDLIL